jgi:hypothetical protein
MEYVIYIFISLALVGFFVYRRRHHRKRIDCLKHRATLRSVEAGGDPFRDRIEFYITKRG